MAPPQAPAANGSSQGDIANGGGGAGGTAAPASVESNGGAPGDHGGSSNIVDGVAAPASPVAANGNGNIKKQRAERRMKKEKKKAAAISPKDKYWTPIDDEEAAVAVEDGGEDGRRPLLFRTYRVKGILLHPYRCVYLAWLLAALVQLPVINSIECTLLCFHFSQARVCNFGACQRSFFF